MSALAHGVAPVRLPIAASALLHVAALATLVLARGGTRVALPPTYRVSLVAAPVGERAIGVVEPAAQPAPATPAPTVREKPAPTPQNVPAMKTPRLPARATPNVAQPVAPSKTVPAAAAGGGPEGGRGADVANVKVDGINFPYPVYLQNIVRQIALQFRPASRSALSAEVAFIIRRDGSMAGLRLTRRSSVYSFDQDALAAVELASPNFGPLPARFPHDALPRLLPLDPL